MKNLIACIIGFMLLAGGSSFAEGTPVKHVKHLTTLENVSCPGTSCSTTSCPSTCPKECCASTSCSKTTGSPKGATSVSTSVGLNKTACATPRK